MPALCVGSVKKNRIIYFCLAVGANVATGKWVLAAR